MGEVSSNSILERKVAKGRENHQAKAMTVQKALRLSVAKVAEELHDLPLAAIGIKTDLVANAELEPLLNDETLLLLLDGPWRQTGLAIVDKSFAGALVQQQTTGVVRPESDEGRRLTNTDAALAAPILDALLKRVANTVESETDAAIFSGFRFGSMSPDVRLALMALEANEFNHFSVTLDVAKGARQSTLQLFFPIPDDNLVLEDIDDYSEEASAQEGKNQHNMAETVFHLEADLDVVLCKMRLPLGVLEQLQPGQAIQLPPNAFPDVSIAGVGGQIIGKGVVGQIEGQRAVQLARKPNYAETPMRRESDKAALDLPEVEEMMGQTASVPALPGMDLPDLPADLPGGDLPALPSDLPDLPDMDMPDPAGATEDAPLPDLPPIDGLPELDDLPDLADLGEMPDLKMA